MNAWQLLTMEVPIESERDVMARIGLRFFWCTGPYFLIALVLSKFGVERLLESWSALFILLIPFVGGAIDGVRLKRQREAARIRSHAS